MSSLPAGGPFKAAMGVIESLSRDHVKKTIDIVSSYCGTKSNGEFCNELIKQLQGSSKLVSRIRLRDMGLSGGERLADYEGLDKDVFIFIKEMIKIYAYHIAGNYLVTDSGNVVVKVKKNFRHPSKNIQLLEGDYTFLSFSDSIILTALGLVSPVESSVVSTMFNEEQIFNARG
ncbi:MAG: hypothetical protein GSR79_07925 [Desulfurococcales archaeon]|nr:hypothetical protein [Desulfurococcales archaeon]